MADAGSLHGGDAALPGPPEEQELSQRLRRLYPAVNQEETPLPRSWSPKDKYNYIGLSQGNLRVHYKGAGLGRRRRVRLRPRVRPGGGLGQDGLTAPGEAAAGPGAARGAPVLGLGAAGPGPPARRGFRRAGQAEAEPVWSAAELLPRVTLCSATSPGLSASLQPGGPFTLSSRLTPGPGLGWHRHAV